MPITKHTFARYKILDEILSNRHCVYDIHDFVEAVNRKMRKYDGDKEVGIRTIQKDLKFLDEELGATLERRKIDGRSVIRYKQPGFSIFTKELSSDEKHILREVLGTLGQFDGLENFSWLCDLQNMLGVKNRKAVISFQPSLSKKTRLLGQLFTAISNKVVIFLKYHTFHDKTTHTIEVHPYLLKQHNCRWFLICAACSDGFPLTFPLDNITYVEERPEMPFEPCSKDLQHRFDDVVGVTLHKDDKVEDIIIWVDDRGFPYIDSKPMHRSYRSLTEAEETEWRTAHPNLTGGHYISLHCIVNEELIMQLQSYGPELVVVSPNTLRDTLKQRILAQKEKYLL